MSCHPLKYPSELKKHPEVKLLGIQTWVCQMFDNYINWITFVPSNDLKPKAPLHGLIAEQHCQCVCVLCLDSSLVIYNCCNNNF